MLVRMPELGAMKKGQASSLAGVAPYDRDSGGSRGVRSIYGGRARARRMLYMAALAARRSDPQMKSYAQRLQGRGKRPKMILVAIMRKLAEAANGVLQRKEPWVSRQACEQVI